VAKHQPTDTLEELESLGERLLGWVEANPVLVLAVAGAILFGAAGLGGWRAWQSSRADRASTALAELRTQFVVAMGGTANDSKVPEPANPDTARSVRTEYVGRFVELARAHGSAAAAALAWLEASEIYQKLGQADRALEVVQEGAKAQPADAPLRAVLEARIARFEENAGRFEDAAKAYQAAAAVPGYPLRVEALGDAARCYAEAGNREAALAVYATLQTEAPDRHLEPHIEARLKELQVRP